MVNEAEPWEAFFWEEVKRHPEIEEKYVPFILGELAESASGQRKWRGEKEFHEHMIGAVRKSIKANSTRALAIIRMRKYDEYRMLHPFDDYCDGSTRESTTCHDKAQADLEKFIAELGRDTDGHDSGTTEPSECTPAVIAGGQACGVDAGTGVESATHEITVATLPVSGVALEKDDKANSSVVDYYYIDTDEEQSLVEGLSDRDLLVTLDDLLTQSDSGGKLVPYHSIRSRYCALSEVMNRRGVVPPRFRPKRPLTKLLTGAKHDLDDTLMMRDRQILDMHWLHCRGKRDQIEGGKYSELFVGDELDFKLAADLATKAWSLKSKVFNVLNLIPYEEWQMAYLRSKETDDAWRNTFTTMRTTIDRRLREQALKDPSLRPHIEDLKHLWAADKMAGGLGQKVVGDVHGWLSGSAPLATSTLSPKLRRMKRRTAPNSAAK